jgi:DNA helicase-2/ATP-dependent DNA helicase PcrA
MAVITRAPELTESQQFAVAHDRGPLLILAGAGTGKTRVLVERYRRLRQEGVPADGILLLTFTDKAARELVDRVEREDYLPTAERWVTTYHAFALRFVQEHGWLDGLPRVFRLASSVRKWETMRDVLADLRPASLYHPQRPAERVKELLKLVERLKQEMISPVEFSTWAEGTPAGPDPEAAQQVDAAAVYLAYQRRMVDGGLLDFDDTIFHTVRVLEAQPAVSARQGEQFRYVMVDEFQDTNFAQSRMLELLTGSHRNLCVVGDDDQSIYKFRGASVSNLRRFQALYPEAAVIRLEENFRSRGPVLRAAQRLIEEDPGRLGKRLETTRGEGPPVGVLAVAGVAEEADAVAAFIKTALGEGRFAPRDVAVLLRANAHLQNFARALQRAEVAYQVSGGRGFYQQPEIKDCLAYLRVIDDPDDPISLMRLLALPRYTTDPVQAGRWARQARDQGLSLFTLLEGSQEPGAGTLCADLRRFAELALRSGVDDLFYEVMEQTRYLDLQRFVTPLERLQVSANVQKLAELIAAYCDEHTDHHLGAYLDHLEGTESAQVDEEIAALDDSLNAVHVMTVHQAKGLEFGLVILPHLVEGRFPATRRAEGLRVPDALLKEELPAVEVHLSEERRLAYVGITRAREELLCTWAGRYEGSRDWRPSRFLTPITGREARALALSDLVTPAPRVVEVPRQVELPLEEVPRLTALSYTQVDTYQRCPQAYQYRFVFRLPTRPRPQMQFGRILHDTLRNALAEIESDRPLSWDMVESAYVEAWSRERFIDPAQAAPLKACGLDYLRRAFARGHLGKPLLLEQPFSLLVDGLRLTGRIDRIDRHPDGTYEVIDYKTGAPRRAGDLQRDLQLGVYAMAAREVFRFDPLKLTYFYLETGDRVSVDKPTDRLDEDREVIRRVADGIRRELFTAKPERVKCAGCDFRLLCPSAAV